MWILLAEKLVSLTEILYNKSNKTGWDPGVNLDTADDRKGKHK